MHWLKRSMPRSLYGRAALILLLPVVTIQLVLSITFIQRHFEGVTDQMTGSVELELSLLADRIDAAPTPRAAREVAQPLARALSLDTTLPDPTPVASATRRFYDLSGRVVISILQERLEGLRGIDLATDISQVHLTVDTRNGPVAIRFPRYRVSASNPHQLLVLMVVVSLLMTLIAYLFLRNQLRPVKRLAAAAEAFGRGRVVPYRPSGATEVRAAGHAFLDMRMRIERQTQQRTLMLSGVSHDLRTPLTRMKLSLSMLDDNAETEDLSRDVAEMEEMLATFLDFARLEALDDSVECDPAEVAGEAVARAHRAGHAVALGRIDGAEPVMLRPQAMARALDNLLGNAVRYGTRARLSVAVTERAVVFSVEDDGPGIPPEARDEAMKPFQRLDTARNQNRGGGVGLGLAIAADIARQHGGVLRLGDSADLGGLRADMVLAR